MADLDTSFAQEVAQELKVLNTPSFKLQKEEIGGWHAYVKNGLRVQQRSEMTKERFMTQTKGVLSDWLEFASTRINNNEDLILKLIAVVDHLQTDSLADKAKIIKLQSEIIECKDRQLQSVQSAMETAVQTTMKKEMRQYSDVVGKQNSSPALSQQTLKKVVKNAIIEEDRSKNLMIFGLQEDEKENIDDKVAEIFSELDEKPRAVSSRVGKPRTSGHSRPVKVCVSSSAAAQQLLLKSGRLKQVEKFKTVFVCPDRSPEERASRRQLVLDLRNAVKQHPDLRHYISARTDS